MYKHLLVFLFFCICVCGFSQIQTSVPNIVPPSPTSMQFQKYGDYPVNHFTGVPSISIPLYTISEGELQVPITLSYHASGTRVDDVSGFVGLGWTLNVGGMITRTIQGFPDDGIMPFQIPGQLAQNINWSDAPYATELDQIEGIRDHEYDIWNYNFLGRSGKYIINSNGVFPIEATTLKLNQPGLTIIDENGIEYSFGSNGIETTEYSDPINSVIKSAATTFPLGAIKSFKDPSNTIGFEYQTGPNYQEWMNINTYVFDDWWADNINYNSSNFPYSLTNAGGIQNGSYLMRNQTYCPKAIYFRNGQIKFIQNAITKMLTRIEVLDNSNIVIKAIDFNITAFPNTSPGHSVFKNYKLQSISVKDAGDAIGETYEFNYYNENINPLFAKPMAFQGSKDHWGFYNGPIMGSTRLLTFQGFLSRTEQGPPYYRNFGDGASKEPSEEYTKMYVLNKIIFPTGGYTTFDFEQNRTSNNLMAGGLRIKTITNYNDNNQIATEKNYSYYLGQFEVLPSYDYYLSTTNLTGYINSVGGIMYRRVTLTEDPFINMAPRGSSLTYENVVEDDGNSSISYRYDNGNAYTYEDLNYPGTNGLCQSPNWYFKKRANNYKPWNFGNLTEKVTTGINFFQSESTEYEEFVVATIRDFLIERWLAPECLLNCTNGPCPCSIGTGFDYITPLSGTNVFNFADRYYHSGGKRVKKTITKYRSSNAPLDELVTTKEFFYENPQRPTIATKIITSNSKGEIITTNLKYPFDFQTTVPYGEMVNRNIISPVIEQTDMNASLSKQLSKRRVNYSFWQGNSIIQPSSLESSLLNSSLETEATISEYDEKGNMLQVTGKDGVVSSFVFGYNKTLPVAKIIGKTYSETISQSGINLSVVNNPSNESVLKAELAKLRLLPGAFVTTYTYKPLIGVTSETDPNGRTIYYEYDAFNRLHIIRDKDNNIIKKICYNYSGQVVNCNTPCTNTEPYWQNTSTPLRCQAGPCGNTGFQEQEQLNVNPCSSGYQTQTQWVVAGYNPTACTPASNVTITYQNILNTVYTATYTNLSTNQVYTFTVPAAGTGTLGCIPAGTYSLLIVKSGGGNPPYALFSTGCANISGTSAFFRKAVNVSTGGNCNLVSIAQDY